MIIDAHQHFWQYNLQRHSWIGEDMQAIRRSFMPADLYPLLQRSGVDGTMLVQVDQTPTETDFCLQLASENEWIRGVVGWIDLRAANITELAAALRLQSKLKGFRHIVQSEPDPNFLLRPQFVQGIKAIGRLGFTYDLLIYPHQLPAALQLVAACPNQPFVLDHLAKPYIRKGDIAGWAKAVKQLGSFEHIWVKVSGLVTEADWHAWKPEDIYPYIENVLEAFGANRLMWGSDWPVCLVASEYKEVLDLVQGFIAKLSATEQAAIMGSNALAFYQC